MSHFRLVFISGSPSSSSRSHRLLDALARRVESATIATRLYSIREFNPAALLGGDTNDANVRRLIQDATESDCIVVATPVYKGTFAGTLKVLLDVIPPDALRNKLGIVIATARIPGHLETAAAGLGAIFDFFALRVQPAPLLLVDDAIFDPEAPTQLTQAANAAIEDAAQRVQSLLPLLSAR